MDLVNDTLFELAQERIAALGQVKAHDWQREALAVAAEAIRAHANGPEAWDAFVKEQKEKGKPFIDVFRQLWGLPEVQPDKAYEAVEFTKLLMTDDASYKKVLECSDRGDKRFDPEFARVKIGRREETIANLFQEVKQSEVDQGYRRGRRVSQVVDPFTGDKISSREMPWIYRGLWMTYFNQNPELVKYAEQFDKFSNINGRQSLEGRYDEIIEAYVKGSRERYIEVVKCSDWYKNMERKLVQSSLDSQIQNARKVGEKAAHENSAKFVEKDFER